jgi:hypothetical protein
LGSLFLPDFCQFDFKDEPAGFRPDRTGQVFKPAGPDRIQKTCPVPTLISIRTMLYLTSAMQQQQQQRHVSQNLEMHQLVPRETLYLLREMYTLKVDDTFPAGEVAVTSNFRICDIIQNTILNYFYNSP